MGWGWRKEWGPLRGRHVAFVARYLDVRGVAGRLGQKIARVELHGWLVRADDHASARHGILKEGKDVSRELMVLDSEREVTARLASTRAISESPAGRLASPPRQKQWS